MSESTLFACACQIVAAMLRHQWFLSSGYIEVYGQVKSVEVCKNGLRLVLSNHEKVWWAMKGSDAKTIAHLVSMLAEVHPMACSEFFGVPVVISPPNAFQCGDDIEYCKFYRAEKRAHIAYYSYHDDKSFWSRIESHENGYFDMRTFIRISHTCIDDVIWIV